MNLNEQLLAGWKQQFHEDGFLRIPKLFTPVELSVAESQLDHYTSVVAPHLPPTDVVWESEPLPDGTRQVRNFWRMEHHSRYFGDLAGRPELLRLAGVLVNGDPVLSAVELFAKPAYVGSAVPYHQDNAYFNLTPPDSFTMWIALDASTTENGCVYYCRSSHREQPVPHKASGIVGNSMMAASVPPSMEEVPGLLDPGDAMVHHCLTLHRSEPNRSDRARRGLLIVYRGAHCQTDPDGARQYAAVRAART
jgi:hypothetical protein